MSTATARHHLRVLVADGRLEMIAARKLNGKGRPEKLYSIPRAMYGDNLSGLAEALWAEAGRSVRVEALSKHLAVDMEIKDQPAALRLRQVVERLNQMKYHARWEAGSAGPRIIFGHCPYAALIEKHPELCKMDASLLERWMGGSAEPSATIRDGSASCVFILRQ
jgi:predicted ArsR family transcriptional regulator